MRSRTVTQLLAGLLIAALAVFAYTLFNSTLYFSQTTGIPPLSVQTPVATSSLPARLIVPVLKINASVQDLGVNSIGNMQAPDNFVDVGWYKFGTVPGYVGSAVIDGHVDNGLGLAGVFLKLNTIQVGDDVYVQTIGGDMLHFVVQNVTTYPYQSVPVDQVFAQNDAARLNLITCDGTWVNGQDTYNERLVVYTKYVGESQSAVS
jgi:LPXTG-site transpeptidase (sortase) family protein